MKIRTIIFTILAISMAFCILSCGEAANTINYPVDIMLANSENLTISGSNVITVNAGEAAEFSVSVPEGMKVADISDGAYYKDGKIIIENVYFPTTIKTYVREYFDCTYSTSATKGGKVGEAQNITVREDDEVKIKAAADKGYTFVGWSDGESLEDGGEIFSRERVHTFNITKDMDLVANFVREGSKVIRYYANGGDSVKSKGGDTYVDVVTDSYHFYANSLPDVGYFKRDGYILYGYNTKPNGDGEYIGLGSNIAYEDEFIDLYCLWAKESPVTDFEYVKNTKNIRVTKYNGNDTVVVVPEEIEGLPVTVIAEYAFEGCAAETVILPNKLLTIARFAFNNCSLKELYFPDSVIDVSDRAFDGCENFSTLYVNAVTYPKYQKTNHGTYAIKFERLMYAYKNDLKMLAFTSGSNGTYGVYSYQLEEALDNEYFIIDYSCHFHTCGVFFLDLISQFVSDEDIVLFLPEPVEHQLGSLSWNAIMWQIFEGAYEAISYIDIRDYENVFQTFSDFNKTRQWMADTDYTDYWEYINRYGDNDWYRAGNYKGFISPYGGTYNLNPSHINVKNLNAVTDKILNKGAKAYLSFASMNDSAAEGVYKQASYQKEYENYMRNNLKFTVISSIDDYIFDGRYISDSNFHLSSVGTKIRTKYLAKDIIAQLRVDYPDTWGKKSSRSG